MAAIQPHTTQLEFYQAMADFKTMFPLMDDDVIEAVLRSNEGAVDATIDQLLAMSTDNENEKIRHELELKDDPSRPNESIISSNNDAGEPLRRQRGWDGMSLLVGTLPDDFLRLHPDPTQSEVELEDERIAMLLQNEEFMAELRWNKDFLSTLEKESPQEERSSEFSTRLPDDEAAFKERLKHMGKMSKKKFSQLARVFTGRKKRGAKSILNQQGAKENLLLREDADSD